MIYNIISNGMDGRWSATSGLPFVDKKFSFLRGKEPLVW
jgi:hypothetical protein